MIDRLCDGLTLSIAKLPQCTQCTRSPYRSHKGGTGGRTKTSYCTRIYFQKMYLLFQMVEVSQMDGDNSDFSDETLAHRKA